MQPTLRQLIYLKRLAEHKSFQKAAEAAFVSQPALSSGLAELEKILGARLVDRARGTVILTAAGETALKAAEDILARVDDMVDLVRASNSPLSGRFRLGIIPTIAPFLLPNALLRLRQDYPQLKLYLREDQTARLLAALRAGQLEAAVIALPFDMAGLDSALIGRDAIMATLPQNHPLAEQKEINPQDIPYTELILLEDGHCLRDHALAACSWSSQGGGIEGFSPLMTQSSFSATSLNTLVQMVDSGLGISLMPEMALRSNLLNATHLAVRPLVSDHAYRDIAVVWRTGSTRATEAKLLATLFRA